MSVLQFSRKFYGKLHVGKPFGIDLRQIVETIDRIITTIFTFHTTFPYKNHRFHYFFHPYNLTITNERMIEIPIFQSIINKYPSDTILEIGNVLSHYQKCSHCVIDKYEVAHNVLNQDAVNYHSLKKFDCIIGISTFEHIGQDEKPHDPKKAVRAVNHIRGLLTKQGKCIISIPVGHNQALDQFVIQYAQHQPSLVTFYLRTGSHQWQPSTLEKVVHQQYGHPYPCANGLIIAEFHT